MKLELIQHRQSSGPFEEKASDIIAVLVEQYNTIKDALKDKYPSYLYSIIERLCKSPEHPEPFFPEWDATTLRIHTPDGLFITIKFIE